MSEVTFDELVVYGEKKLKEAGITDYRIDTRLLIEYIFEVNRSFLLIHGNEKADEEKIKAFYDAIEKREKRIPLQHITGESFFMDYRFLVNEHVLVPRQDTEVLVEKSYEICKNLIKKGAQGLKVLDMCTGSGIIAISLYRMLVDNGVIDQKKLEVLASDISEAALEIASKNAELNNADIKIINSDLFDEIKETNLDLIVSNPPYIPSRDIEELEIEVKEHDPYNALDGGETGLDFYEKIIKEAKRNEKEFSVAFEIGYNQGEDVKKLLLNNGYKNVEAVKDLANMDRVVTAYKE